MSNTYCPMPFVTLTVNPGNYIARCMMSLANMGPIERTTYSNDAFKTLRSNQLKGIWDKEGCSTCYHKEQDGQQSQRTKWLEREVKYLREEGIYKSNLNIERNKIYHLYMNFSNVCNFKCRMCGPHFSNSWISDYNKLTNNTKLLTNSAKFLSDADDEYEYRKQVDVDKFLEEYGNDLSNLRQIWITGGEPFIDDKVFGFFDKLSYYSTISEIDVTINTNASKLEVNNLEYLKKLRRLHINVSVDGTDKFYDYMRGNNFTFNELDEKMKELVDLQSKQKNLLITVNGAFQIYNMINIDNFFTWAINVLGETDAGHIEHRVLIGPPQLRARNAPLSLKKESKKQVKNLISKFPTQFYLSDILDELNKNVDVNHINRFKVWNTELDKLRNQDIDCILPNLYDDWKKEGYLNA